MKPKNLSAGTTDLESCLIVGEEKASSLHMEMYHRGEAIVLHCKGRIVFRDEAVALSRRAAELLQRSQQLVLDLSGVEAIDSAGLGQLVLLHMWAEGNRYSIKLARPTKRVHELLEMTNVASIFEIHNTVDGALKPVPSKVHRLA